MMRSVSRITIGMLWAMTSIGSRSARSSRIRRSTPACAFTPSAAVGSSSSSTLRPQKIARAIATP